MEEASLGFGAPLAARNRHVGTTELFYLAHELTLKDHVGYNKVQRNVRELRMEIGKSRWTGGKKEGRKTLFAGRGGGGKNDNTGGNTTIRRTKTAPPPPPPITATTIATTTTTIMITTTSENNHVSI